MAPGPLDYGGGEFIRTRNWPAIIGVALVVAVIVGVMLLVVL